jgi:hypothetical protein
MAITTADADIELTAADGVTILPLMLARPRDPRTGEVIEGSPVTLSDMLQPYESDSPISKGLIADIQEDWAGGVGIAYSAAEAVYTRTPGFACPAGNATPVTIPVTWNSNTPITKFDEFGSDLWAVQRGDGSPNTARILRNAGGGSAAFTNSLLLGANEYMQDMCVFDNGAGANVLYASSSNVGGLSGRLHKWDGATWTSTAAATFGTNGRQRLAKVFWTTPDGQSAWRLVAISGQKSISYTKPRADPMLAASWIEDVRIETAGTLLELVAARRHVYVTAVDGVFDLDEQGNSPNLTSYWSRMQHIQNGYSAEYLDGYVYASLGQGLDRIRVDQGAVLQENIGQCSPGWGTPAENNWRGSTTALAIDQGFLVNAVYNPAAPNVNGASGVFWGKDRNVLQIQTPNPLVWYGPEVTVTTGGYYVTKMRTFAFGGTFRLWIACVPYYGGAPIAAYISVPVSGSPLQDLLASGESRFAPGQAGTNPWQAACSLKMLPKTTGDKAALKIIYQHGIGSRGLDAATGTKLVQYSRADPVPGSQAWGSGTDVTADPSTDLTPSVVVAGHKTEMRIDFVSPSGTATPPRAAVLDALRTLVWRIAPTTSTKSIPVEYGDGVVSMSGVRAESEDPDWISAQLKLLTESGRTTIRDRQDKRWVCKIEQVLDGSEVLTDSAPYGKRVVKTLQISVLGVAA